MNQQKKIEGFTLIEMMIVVAIIGLLVGVAIPNLIKSRKVSQKNACIKNLQQIDGAKERWALETKAGLNTPLDLAQVNSYIKDGAPACPASGRYEYEALGTPPTCTVSEHVLPEEAAQSGDPVPAGAP